MEISASMIPMFIVIFIIILVLLPILTDLFSKKEDPYKEFRWDSVSVFKIGKFLVSLPVKFFELILKALSYLVVFVVFLKNKFINATTSKKIITAIIAFLGAAASVYTIASYYQKPPATASTSVSVQQAHHNSIESNTISNGMGSNIAVSVKQNSKVNISSIVTNPLNIGFSIIMIILSMISVYTYNTINYKDFKSTISSIGILGTFVGLFIGLLGFDTNHIETSIPLLLDGLKVAFFTSVVGLSLSISVTILEVIRAK